MMFVILCYDVGVKRVSKMLKTAKKYLSPVQRSVFQGNLTEATLHRMQHEITQIIDTDSDSVIVYCMSSPSVVIKAQIGKTSDTDDNFI